MDFPSTINADGNGIKPALLQGFRLLIIDQCSICRDADRETHSMCETYNPTQFGMQKRLAACKTYHHILRSILIRD